MRDILTLFLHAIVIIIRLGRPGGLRSVVSESVLLRHQILILNRGRKRAPNLRSTDRILAGLCCPPEKLWGRPILGRPFSVVARPRLRVSPLVLRHKVSLE